MPQYYYRIFGVKFGPVSLELLQHEIASGQLLGRHEVRAENASNWMSVDDFVAHRVVDRNPVQQLPHSTLTWDGGHDDVETAGVGGADQSIKTLGVWFCRGSQIGRGPFNFDELCSYARRRELVADDELSLTEHGPWTPVRSIGRLMEQIPQTTITGSISPLMSAATNTATESVTQTPDPLSAGHQLVSADQRSVLADHQSVSGDTEVKTQWYVRMGHVEHGPIELQKMIEMVEAGRILPMDRVRQSDKSEWTQAHAIPALFPSTSKSNQAGSTFSLKSIRPTIPVPQSYTKKGGYSAHVVPVPPIMQVAVQHVPQVSWPSTSPSPAHSTAQQPVRSMETAPLPAAQARALISDSGLPVESNRQPAIVQVKSPPTQRATERNVDIHQSSQQRTGDLTNTDKVESKHKLRRGQFKEPQLIDAKNIIMLAGILLALLFAWRSLMTASVEDFIMPYNDLCMIHRTLEGKRSENQTMDLWAFARKESVYKIESIKQKIRNLNSKHPIRNKLLAFGDSLAAAAKSDTRDDVTNHMQDAFKWLVDTSKEFRKWKDGEFQKELQRRRHPNARLEAEKDR
ncbi:MAG: GYF domain-containing protein [Schlesneria sp.]